LETIKLAKVIPIDSCTSTSFLFVILIAKIQPVSCFHCFLCIPSVTFSIVSLSNTTALVQPTSTNYSTTLNICRLHPSSLTPGPRGGDTLIPGLLAEDRLQAIRAQIHPMSCPWHPELCLELYWLPYEASWLANRSRHVIRAKVYHMLAEAWPMNS
jgi:hypothetical protein